MSHTHHHRDRRPSMGERITERIKDRGRRKAARAALRRIAREYAVTVTP